MNLKRRWSAAGGALASVVALAATTALVTAAPAVAAVNEVLNWNKIAVETLVAFPPAAGGAPPASQINVGMTQGAVYDAVNAIEPRREPYLLERRFATSASKEAAVVTAAYRVLTWIIATAPAFPTTWVPDKGTLQQRLDAALAASLGAIADSASKTEGIAAGNAAADVMIAARQNDGRFGPSQWVPNSDPGHWQPDVIGGMPQLDPTPWVGGVRPFLMTSSSQFRTDGPNALTSTAYAEDFNEVKALGSVNSTARTPEQTHIAIFWQSTPIATWNAVARELAERFGTDLVDSAALFAMQNLTAADAGINCWNDKYYWDFWRPAHAIHEAARDGNPATEPDPSWTQLITAPYPEHPSGHLCQDGSHLRVLQRFFGTDKPVGGFEVTSARFPGEVRHFDRFSQPIKEIIEARIWAGLHFRTADVQAQILGRKVAHYMANHYFQPLP
jgi:hypothetical protein